MVGMTNDLEKTPVTILGMGAMGQALATAFLKAGHPTTIWNRSPGKGDDLVARGAARATSAREAVRAADLVVICVVDHNAVGAVLDSVADELPGRVLVNLTSDTPERARTTGAWAQERGIDYLDGSIMVPVDLIGQPPALIFYSGPRAAYDKHETALKALGGKPAHLGEDQGWPPSTTWRCSTTSTGRSPACCTRTRSPVPTGCARRISPPTWTPSPPSCRPSPPRPPSTSTRAVTRARPPTSA